MGSWEIENLSPSTKVSIGILLTILGACLMALGNALMKIGVDRERQPTIIEANVQPWSVNQPVWWLGLVLYIVGAVAHLLALGFAPASILSPMNSVGLISNAIVAVTILQETFSWEEALGTFGIIVGVLFCGVATYLPSKMVELKDTLDGWREPWYIFYVGVILTFCLISFVMIHNEEGRIVDSAWTDTLQQYLERGARSRVSAKHHTETELLGELEIARSNTDDIFTQQLIFPTHIAVLYGLLSGTIGSQVVLETKEVALCLEVIFSAKVGSNNTAVFVQLGVSWLLLTFSAILQIHFLNFGLGRGEANLVIPTYYVSWTIFGTLGGFSKFREAEGFSATQLVLFLSGLLITLICVGYMGGKDLKRPPWRNETRKNWKLPVVGIGPIAVEQSGMRRTKSYDLLCNAAEMERGSYSSRWLHDEGFNFHVKKKKPLEEIEFE